MISASVERSTLNMLLGISKALGLILGPAKLTTTITKTVKKKDNPMHIRKGICQVPLASPVGNAVYKNVSCPNKAGAKLLNNTDMPNPVPHK